MSKPIKIEYLAEVAAYLRDVKKVELSTEDVAEALVATSNSGEDLERKLSRAMRDAAKDTEVLERAVRDLPKATDDAARQADRDFERFGDSARDAGREAGGEFAQNFGSALASGDMKSVAQETLGGLVSSLGGGGVAGAAVAAGAGLALAMWNAFNAKSEEMKAKVSEMLGFTDLLTGELDKVAKVEAALTELGGGDYAQGIRDARKYSQALGIDYNDLVDLITGDVNPATQKTYENIKEQTKWTGENTEEMYAVRDATKEVLATTDLNREAVERANEAAAAQRGYWLDANEAIDPLVAKVQEMAGTLEKGSTWKIGLDFYANDPIGQSLISSGNVNYSPGHVSIAQSQLREGRKKAG